ncbi:multiple organellar RNA editing factor 8, chloroplastic/mitochondrial [Lucilia sericata]|uniref:multiple organellar RNA editing factor 8, chloroplastic/mitochondrial n=1 Tax=Lucilia sericata TaxID=13632 RepID=UPI0018A7F933|nr:multiple organellar RNA editing factor 8, chloroplastic/mitochondrial [Lucilia sericata]
MKTKLILVFYMVLLSSLVVLTSAQNRYRNRNGSSNRNRGNNDPTEQGRTLGLIRPLLGLGLSTIARPFTPFGFDAPIAPAASSGAAQSDPYYGGYGGYTPNYYGGYNYFGGYPAYRPFGGYPLPFFGGYRPQVYPGNYGGYPPYNGYGAQRPLYSNSRPSPIAQRPNVGQQSGLSPTSPAVTTPMSGSATANPQAAQVANLLGQLLGQQLRPLLNQGAASPAHDVPGVAPSSLQERRYRNRTYLG